MNFYLNQFDDVLVEKENHILWITLNRPEASNAYSNEMVQNLVMILRHADQDQDVRAIVLTGNGKNFCAGGDIKAMQNKTGMFAGESNQLKEAYQNGIQQIPLTLSSMKTPVIAMVNGAAVGAGCDLAAMCDLRICAETASFAETFAKVGLVPGDGGAFFLIRVVGFAKAMEMFLTCRTYSAREALEMKLVNEVVLPENLKKRAREIAQIICELPPIAVQMTKKSVVHAYENDIQTHLELVSSYQAITQRSSDHFLALEAMLEKKKVSFKHS